MTMTKEELTGIARMYWRPDKEYRLRQEKSPEDSLLEARWEEELARPEKWQAVRSRLRQLLPGFTLGNGTATPDACFRCIAYPDHLPSTGPQWLVVGCVSILAPIYMVYAMEYVPRNRQRTERRLLFEPFPPQMQSTADVISRQIEETFGYSKIPREIAETPVPLFVQWVEPPETTLFHALFTNEPDNLP